LNELEAVKTECSEVKKCCEAMHSELTQQYRIIDSLRGELSIAREEKSAMEQRYRDKLGEIDGMRMECDEVTKSFEVCTGWHGTVVDVGL